MIDLRSTQSLMHWSILALFWVFVGLRGLGLWPLHDHDAPSLFLRWGGAAALLVGGGSLMRIAQNIEAKLAMRKTA